MVIFALLVGPSMMLVNMQKDATDDSVATPVPWVKTILQDYYDGTIGQNQGEDVPPIIFQARVLVRLLLHAGREFTRNHITVVKLNENIQLCCVWGALFLIYRTTFNLGLKASHGLLACLLGVVFVPWGFMAAGAQVSYPYDLPALFVSAAGVFAIISRRFVVLLVVVAVGTLNKETAFLLIPAYFLAEWPEERMRWLPLFARTGLLIFIFILSYEIPRLVLENHRHMIITMSAHEGSNSRWFLNLKMLCKLGPSVRENVYWVALLHVPALMGFRILPWKLKAIYLSAPLFLGPIFMVGNIYELRLYNELIPLGAIGSTLVLAKLFDSFQSERVP